MSSKAKTLRRKKHNEVMCIVGMHNIVTRKEERKLLVTDKRIRGCATYLFPFKSGAIKGRFKKCTTYCLNCGEVFKRFWESSNSTFKFRMTRRHTGGVI